MEIARHESVEPVEPDEVIADRPTVVAALPLKRQARERLASLLGARVVDVRVPVDAVDLVLTPSCSPQLIGRLKSKYGGARVVVVELDDWDLDIQLGGPVKRILRSGADAYLLADSLDELAAKLVVESSAVGDADGSEPVVMRELTEASTVDDIIAAFLNESVEYATRVRVARGGRLGDD